jgi:hypothetical protein
MTWVVTSSETLATKRLGAMIDASVQDFVLIRKRAIKTMLFNLGALCGNQDSPHLWTSLLRGAKIAYFEKGIANASILL